MNPHTNELLRKILEKTEENNELLKKMHRSAIWGRVFKIAYWVIIIGIALGAYYFIQPYIENLMAAYSAIQPSGEGGGIGDLLGG